MTCYDFFSNLRIQELAYAVQKFQFTAQIGYNKFLLDSPLSVKKGSMIMLNYNDYISQVSYAAIDTSGNALVSDFYYYNGIVQRLDSYRNWKILCNALIETKFYYNEISIGHKFDYMGMFNITARLLNSTSLNLSRKSISFVNCESRIFHFLNFKIK